MIDVVLVMTPVGPRETPEVREQRTVVEGREITVLVITMIVIDFTEVTVVTVGVIGALAREVRGELGFGSMNVTDGVGTAELNSKK